MGFFKTKARAIELLGKKQIRDSVTALAEIMKNSYDADAEILRVDFLTRDIDTPCIVICDNGYGMNKTEIENKWLVLGTSSKKETRNKLTPEGRTLMGEKGIGRLAVSRLGSQMWMFTKKVDSQWNILYMNWLLFENPDLFIEDITVPVAYEVSTKNFSKTMGELKLIQYKNLEVSIWNEEKYKLTKELIKKQIDISLSDVELVLDYCQIIENNKNQGTIILSQNLNDDWDRYLEPTISDEEDNIADKNYNRFITFFSDLTKVQDDFKPEVFLNDKPIEISAYFDEKDYDIYDLKIEGFIKNGLFIGKLDARNADKDILKKCNDILLKGISVTAGIRDWRQVDCGPYSIKLCHFEMETKKSGLTSDELKQITTRVAKNGGIGVYRDNVRVLPYGEPENDFLGLERRRSKSAKYYLFSHRNMFGRIDIKSKDNPGLEDKSSREGFIENQQYYYFIRTLENLLMTIAVEFVGDMKKNALKLRQSYIKYNTSETEKREKALEYEKEQKRLLKEALCNTKDQLKSGKTELSDLNRKIALELRQLHEKVSGLNANDYQEISDGLSFVTSKQYELNGIVDKTEKKLKIFIEDRFEGDFDSGFLLEVDDFNQKLKSVMCELRNQINEECNSSKNYINQLLSEWSKIFMEKLNVSPDDAQKSLQENINKLKCLVDFQIQQSKLNIDAKSKELEQILTPMSSFIKTIEQFHNTPSKKLNDLLSKVEKIVSELSQKNNNLKSIKLNSISRYIGEINNAISSNEEMIYNIIKEIDDIANEEFANLNAKIRSISKKIVSEEDERLIDQLTIRNNELLKQVDIYSDLANLGLSVEIVSHEFNQLFHNVYDSINQMRNQSIPADAKYYLKQIEIGFRAISDRLNQLSPMYRTRSMYKQKQILGR